MMQPKKLLLCTQSLDQKDPVLGFFHRWVEVFAASVDEVTVIALRVGEYDLPKNVRVFSLGKEEDEGRSLFARFRYTSRFFRIIFRERRSYDTVFVHMNQIYVLLGGILWRMMGKRIGLWYVHRATTLSLWCATVLVHRVFTSSPESFRINTSKVRYMGHGIDVALFPEASFSLRDAIPTILVVGRVTKIKRLDVVIRAAARLREKGVSVRVRVVGGPTSPVDEKEARQLHSLAESLGITDMVDWVGPVPRTALPAEYARSSVGVNASPNGGTDKVVLESLLSGRPVFFSNAGLLPYYGDRAATFQFPEGDDATLALEISRFLVCSLEEQEESARVLAERTRAQSDLSSLVFRICSSYYTAQP